MVHNCATNSRQVTDKSHQGQFHYFINLTSLTQGDEENKTG